MSLRAVKHIMKRSASIRHYFYNLASEMARIGSIPKILRPDKITVIFKNKGTQANTDI